ncbi:MAG TPA: hypothetical protein VGR41_00400 [Actinomycetota bacterium]|nr:hypothetical protein [Actinomycetota bacterium]
MGQILLVLALAAAAGVAAYRVSLRLSGEEPGSDPAGEGFLSGDEESYSGTGSDLPIGYRYAVLGPGRRSWQTRLLGFVGIVVIICVAAGVFAVTIYEIGHLLRVTLDGYIGGTSSATPSP